MVSQFGSLGYTIMGKTADLTVVQKTIIDTLHKERIVKQNRSRIWVNFTRNGLRLGSRHQEIIWHTDVSRNLAIVVVRGVLPGLGRRRTGLLPSGPKSSFQMRARFGNQGPRVWRKGGEAHSTCCLKSSVKFPQFVMIWGAMSTAGVGPLCFWKTCLATS